MALEGKLSDFGLPDILQLISIQQKTGVLNLIGLNDQANVRFQNGDIINVSCNSRGTLTDVLKLHLSLNEILTKDDIKQIEATAQSTSQKFEKALVTGRYLSTEQIEKIVTQIMEEIVYDLFTWKEASYSFSPDSSALVPSFPSVVIRGDGLLMEGMRRIDEWPEIERLLPDPKLQFNKNPEIPVNPDELPPDEARIYAKINGQSSIQDLLTQLGLSRYRIYESIANLYRAELIIPVETKKAKAQKKPGEYKKFVEIFFHNLITFTLPLAVLIGMASGGYFYRLLLVKDKTEIDPIERVMIENELSRLQEALRLYFLVHYSFPPTLDDLVTDGIISTTKKESFEKYLDYSVSKDKTSYGINIKKE